MPCLCFAQVFMHRQNFGRPILCQAIELSKQGWLGPGVLPLPHQEGRRQKQPTGSAFTPPCDARIRPLKAGTNGRSSVLNVAEFLLVHRNPLMTVECMHMEKSNKKIHLSCRICFKVHNNLFSSFTQSFAFPTQHFCTAANPVKIVTELPRWHQLQHPARMAKQKARTGPL